MAEAINPVPNDWFGRIESFVNRLPAVISGPLVVSSGLMALGVVVLVGIGAAYVVLWVLLQIFSFSTTGPSWPGM